MVTCFHASHDSYTNGWLDSSANCSNLGQTANISHFTNKNKEIEAPAKNSETR